MMDEQILRQLQLAMLETLKAFDSFCRKHDIKYSLYAGSLLGAVRHQGFIPWDDDLDVCMSRGEYNRFISLWEQEHPEGYILQNKENSKKFTQSFTKIRKNNTTFLQDEWEIGQYHTGIFLDVFPLDRLPSGRMQRLVFKWYCMVYQLMTREFAPPKASAIVRLGSSFILACVPKRYREKVRHSMLRKIVRYNECCDLDVIAIETVASLRKPFAPEMMDTYVDLPFEDGTFMCFAGWDDHLRRKFGDYMQLPPVEEQTWRHHPILIDLHHNYEDIDYK